MARVSPKLRIDLFHNHLKIDSRVICNTIKKKKATNQDGAMTNLSQVCVAEAASVDA